MVLLFTFLICSVIDAGGNGAVITSRFLRLSAAEVLALKISGRWPCRFLCAGNVCRDISGTLSMCAIIFSLDVAQVEIYLLVVLVLHCRSLSSSL
jgi:hypothetical protein